MSITRVLLTVLGACALVAALIVACLVYGVLGPSVVEVTNASGRVVANVTVVADDGWKRGLGEMADDETIRVRIRAQSEGLHLSYEWDGIVRETESFYFEPRGNQYRASLTSSGACTWHERP